MSKWATPQDKRMLFELLYEHDPDNVSRHFTPWKSAIVIYSASTDRRQPVQEGGGDAEEGGRVGEGRRRLQRRATGGNGVGEEEASGALA